MRIWTSLFLMSTLVLLSCGCGASGPSVLNLSGNWLMSLYPTGGLGITAPMVISQTGKNITGTIVTVAGSIPIDGVLSGTVVYGKIANTGYTATVTSNSWNGNFLNTHNGYSGTLNAVRYSGTAAVTSAVDFSALAEFKGE